MSATKAPDKQAGRVTDSQVWETRDGLRVYVDVTRSSVPGEPEAEYKTAAGQVIDIHPRDPTFGLIKTDRGYIKLRKR